MIPHRTPTRSAASVVLTTAFVALAAASIGCGGGSSTTTTSGPTAAFTPDTPAPPAATVALLAGSTSGASVDVRVTVTGVSSFFGAAFRIAYDTTAVQFNGMTNSASFLRQGSVPETNLVFLENHSSTPGEILITATRVDPTVAPPLDVTTTADLVVLNFTARKAIVVGAAAGRLDFGDPKQVCDGTVVGSGCNPIAVTWSGGGVSAQP